MCGLDVGTAWTFTKAVDMASAMHTATAMAEKGVIATTVNRVVSDSRLLLEAGFDSVRSFDRTLTRVQQRLKHWQQLLKAWREG